MIDEALVLCGEGRGFRLARVCLRSKAGLSYLRPRVSGTVFLLHRGLRHSPAGLTLGSDLGEGGRHELWFLDTVALCEDWGLGKAQREEEATVTSDPNLINKRLCTEQPDL